MLIVKKFGGSSVADKERIFNVAKRCVEDYQKGNDVVVVLSAMGKPNIQVYEAFRNEYFSFLLIQFLHADESVFYYVHFQLLTP